MLLMEIPKWNILIHLKLAIFTLSTIGMLVLVMTKAGGVGPIVHRKATVEGAEHSWLLVRFILVSAASCSTFASNASDWQRNATKPSDPILGQLLGFPLSNFIVQVLGMLCASASAGIYGDIVWNPVTLLDMILTDNYTSSIRAGSFFIAAGE
jgi:nucleobase:cation symporter-1, NCS1 family